MADRNIAPLIWTMVITFPSGRTIKPAQAKEAIRFALRSVKERSASEKGGESTEAGLPVCKSSAFEWEKTGKIKHRLAQLDNGGQILKSENRKDQHKRM
jgi:hypothetical protein